jgi:ABC-type bacteriocin/lantibiotic exporter with double-glycine peptidase domain
VTRRRIIVPEVVQTSAMDCGPASLKCLLEGFGIRVSYGRLREACQTDVDGTSIDTLEEVVNLLGLEAEQVMVPADHFFLPSTRALPALVVVRLPNGLTHFVVAWRRHAGLVQVMDPAAGRRWPSLSRFLDELYLHVALVPAAQWRDYAGSPEFLEAVRARMAAVGIGRSPADRLTAAALSEPGWRSIAALDAATRMVTDLVRAGALRRGGEAGRVAERLWGLCRASDESETEAVPADYWSVRPAPPEDGEERLLFKGAVLVRVLGRRSEAGAQTAPRPAAGPPKAMPTAPSPLSPELVAALQEPPPHPGRDLLHFLRADGLLSPLVLVTALALAAGGVIVEALLFRGLVEIGRDLGIAEQRLGACAALILFAVGLLLLELPISSGLLRVGRRLEARLRLAFLEKIPRLGDRYFQSRLTSDMAERSHSIHGLRLLPSLGGQLLRSFFCLWFTTLGIAWIDPKSAPVAVTAAALGVLLPLWVQRGLAERDLRVRSHAGALSRFYLDALLGLVAVRTHGAQRSVRREHERLLVEWARSGQALLRAAVGLEALVSLFGLGLAGWLLLDHLSRVGGGGAVLLLAYWALQIPVLGQELALAARQYPTHRNLTLRLLEPLGAPEEREEVSLRNVTEMATSGAPRGVALCLEGVSVRAAGHTILEGIDLSVAPGSHLAIVGPSGAGKSSLVGIFLGWWRPASGRVLVDGEPLCGERLKRLRQETAWVDPAVQLWNRSFLDNLRYGARQDGALPIGQVIEAAHLRAVLEKLPDGLQTPLGEGGALVAGGEGQRVRLGRAMLRPDARLVILDEPFRGLERGQRRTLLARARAHWRDATLLCVTHDVGETRAFDRVVVLEGGRVVEDDAPEVLAARAGSRYRALLEAEETVRAGLWSSVEWQRLWLEEGRIRAREGGGPS